MSDRTKIADLIECSEEIHLISFNLLDRFLLIADGSANGFRKDTLVKILNKLGLVLNVI